MSGKDWRESPFATSTPSVPSVVGFVGFDSFAVRLSRVQIDLLLLLLPNFPLKRL